MFPTGGNPSSTIACLIAPCVRALKWALVGGILAALLILSSSLSATSHPARSSTTNRTRKAPRPSYVEVKALSSISEKLPPDSGSARRVAPGQVSRSSLPLSSDEHDFSEEPIFRPLRC
jgi:hypothetical protein